MTRIIRAIQALRHRTGPHVLRELAHERRAVAAVEFALVLTPLLMLLFGFIATASIFFSMSTMQNNAQYAALMMATGQIKNLSTGPITTANNTATVACSSSLTSTEVEYYACTGLPSWVPATVTVTENCSTPNVSVTLSASGAAAALADLFQFFSSRTLSVSAVLMKDGQCP